MVAHLRRKIHPQQENLTRGLPLHFADRDHMMCVEKGFLDFALSLLYNFIENLPDPSAWGSEVIL